MNLFNVTQYGITIYQLQLGLLDNSALSAPAHLRFGLYIVSGGSYTLLASTGEVTVYPSPDQVVYATLPTPVTLQLGGLYAMGFWSDLTVYTAYANVYNQLSYSAYSSYTGPTPMPNSLANTCPTCTYAARPIAATGCMATDNIFDNPSNQIYSFCAYIEQTKQPSTPAVNYYDASVYTSLIEYSGVVALAPSTTSNSFGTYQQVLGAIGTQTMVNDGGYYYPSSLTVPAPAGSTFVLGSAAGASNSLYTSGGAFMVDGAGLALALANGVTVTLQYNATSGRLQTVDPVNGVVTGAFTGYQLLPYAPGAPEAACASASSPPVSAAPYSCPSGSTQVVYGDVSTKDLYGYYAQEAVEYLYGNVLYTRAFTVQTSGTTLYQVSMQVFQNPGRLIHLRMGVYAATSITNAAFYTTAANMQLLAQTAEYTLTNPGDGTLTLNLLTPLVVNASTTYYIGYWADSYLYTGYTYWYEFPALWSLYTGGVGLPTTWSSGGSVGYSVPQASATGCVANTAATTFSLCSQFVYASTVVSYFGTVTAIPLNGKTGVYEVISGTGNVTTTLISTGAVSSNYVWNVEAFNVPFNNYVYTSASGSVGFVDSAGLSLVFANAAATSVTQSVIRFVAATSTVHRDAGVLLLQHTRHAGQPRVHVQPASRLRAAVLPRARHLRQHRLTGVGAQDILQPRRLARRFGDPGPTRTTQRAPVCRPVWCTACPSTP